jgi:hypothetical protein
MVRQQSQSRAFRYRVDLSTGLYFHQVPDLLVNLPFQVEL